MEPARARRFHAPPKFAKAASARSVKRETGSHILDSGSCIMTPSLTSGRILVVESRVCSRARCTAVSRSACSNCRGDDDLRVFFSGDTAYFDGCRTIGEQLGPFDVTLVETGAYDSQWPYVHVQPDKTVQAHIDLRGR